MVPAHEDGVETSKSPARDPSDQCPRGSQRLRTRPTACDSRQNPAEFPGPGGWTVGAREQGSQVGGHPESVRSLTLPLPLTPQLPGGTHSSAGTS